MQPSATKEDLSADFHSVNHHQLNFQRVFAEEEKCFRGDESEKK